MLKVKALAIDTLRENVLVLSRECTALRPQRLTGSRKVEVRAGGLVLFANIVIADDDDLVGPDEAGLTMPLFRRLGVAPGSDVDIAPARPPASLDGVRGKIHGATLSQGSHRVRGISHPRQPARGLTLESGCGIACGARSSKSMRRIGHAREVVA